MKILLSSSFLRRHFKICKSHRRITEMALLSTSSVLPSRSKIMTTTATTTTTTSSDSDSDGGNSTTRVVITDIEELHQEALWRGAKSYEDPSTGFTVFTELFHLQRGTCCGNQCRHCPYGWENVARDNVRRPAKVKSGDQSAVQLVIQDIMAAASTTSTSTTNANNANDKKNRGRFKKRVGGTHGGHLTEKNVPYTKKGDKGTSQLLTGERRSKNDAAFEAMGTVDELCSVVGVAHALILERQQQEQQQQQPTGNESGIQSSCDNNNAAVDYGDLSEWLLQVMSRLFDAGSHIAKPARRRCQNDNENDDDSNDGVIEFQADGIGGGLDVQHVEALEDWIDTMTESLPELRNFILPTGSVTAAQFHVCRTVCRRAERIVVPLVDQGVCDPNVLKYLNRLSDFLFVAARYCNFCQGAPEIEYKRPAKRDKQRVAQAREWTNHDRSDKNNR